MGVIASRYGSCCGPDIKFRRVPKTSYRMRRIPRIRRNLFCGIVGCCCLGFVGYGDSHTRLALLA
jgi:hypothetical protein